MNNFEIEPTNDFKQRKAAFETLRAQVRDGDPRAPNWQKLLADFEVARAALLETPEQQYIDEMRAVECEAWQAALDKEARSRDRMVSIICFDKDEIEEGKSVDDAIAECGFADNAAPASIIGDSVVMLLADMRLLSVAALAGILRQMADHVESQGAVIYRGASPFPSMQPADWWVNEMPSGDLKHDVFGRA